MTDRAKLADIVETATSASFATITIDAIAWPLTQQEFSITRKGDPEPFAWTRDERTARMIVDALNRHPAAYLKDQDRGE